MSEKQQKNVLSREQEYQTLFNIALQVYKKKDFKTSYCSFQSIVYRYNIEETKLAYDAKYYLAIYLMNRFGVSKNQNEARSLLKEVST
ncbi:10291_t:CDS:1, partial [Racocetra persica]